MPKIHTITIFEMVIKLLAKALTYFVTETPNVLKQAIATIPNTAQIINPQFSPN